jgi:uncharacterized protein YjbI with pentapeptide repeats
MVFLQELPVNPQMVESRPTVDSGPEFGGRDNSNPPICGYSVNPEADDCDFSLDDINRLLEHGVWRCRRRPNPGTEYCPFHQAPEKRRKSGPEEESISDAELSQMFLALVRDERDAGLIENYDQTGPNAEWPFLSIVPGADEHPYDDAVARRRKQFLAAEFGSFDLSFETIGAPNRYPIDLRGAKTESFKCSKIHSEEDLYLHGVKVDDNLSLAGASVGGNVFLTSSEVDGQVSFSNATIDGGISLRDSKVDGLVTLYNATLEFGFSFSDGKLGEVSLWNATVGGKLLAKDAEVNGEIRFQNATVDGAVRFDNTTINGELSLASVTMYTAVWLRQATIDEVSVRDATVEKEFWLTGATVDGEVSVSDTAVGEEILLTGTTIGGEVLIEGSEVEKEISLERSEVNGDILIKYTKVEGEALLVGATVEGGVTLTGATVGGKVSFQDATIYQSINISEAVIRHSLKLTNVQIGGRFQCLGGSIGQATRGSDVALTLSGKESDEVQSGSRIEGAVSFANTNIHGTLAIGHAGPTDLESSLSLSGVDAQTLNFSADALVHPALQAVDLTYANITNATLRPATDSHPPVYDFEGATIGEVNLDRRRDDNLGIPAYDLLRLVNTTFEDFDFSKHRQEFIDIDWALHQVVQGDSHRDGELDVRIGQALRDNREGESARDAVIKTLNEYLSETEQVESIVECISGEDKGLSLNRYPSVSKWAEEILNELPLVGCILNSDERRLDEYILILLVAQLVLAEKLPDEEALKRFVQRLEAAEAERRIAYHWEPLQKYGNNSQPGTGDTGATGSIQTYDEATGVKKPDESLVGDRTTTAQEAGSASSGDGGDAPAADGEGTRTRSETARAAENLTDTDDFDREDGSTTTHEPGERYSCNDEDIVGLNENETPPDTIAELFVERLARAVRVERQPDHDVRCGAHAPDSEEYGYAEQGDRELLTRLRARADMETGPGNTDAGPVGTSDDENETAATSNRVVGRLREAVGSLRASSGSPPSVSSAQSGVAFPSYSVDDGLQEATYSKAKTAADEVGADDAASQFFVREQRAAERQERQQFWEESPLRSNTDVSSWIKRAPSLLQRFVTRHLTLYGERPRRVLGWWAATILACWALYYVWLTPILNGPALQPERIVDTGLLSVGSFATLLPKGDRLSDGTILPDTLVLIAEMQGLTGVLLLSLFVFTLSRSVRR